MEEVEHIVTAGVMWMKLAIELIGAAVIAWGCFRSVIELWRVSQARSPALYTRLRLHLGRFLALGLEFQLAADILGTAISPTWDEIGKLAAIATIRTALNYFLGLELRQEAAEQAEGREVAPLVVGPAEG